MDFRLTDKILCSIDARKGPIAVHLFHFLHFLPIFTRFEFIESEGIS